MTAVRRCTLFRNSLHEVIWSNVADLTHVYVYCLHDYLSSDWLSIEHYVNISLITLPPEGVARYCFHPVCLSVCVSVYLSVWLCVCPANMLAFYLSAISRDIDLKFIQDTHRAVLNSLKHLTFIDQMSRSQGRYIAFLNLVMIGRHLMPFLTCATFTM